MSYVMSREAYKKKDIWLPHGTLNSLETMLAAMFSILWKLC